MSYNVEASGLEKLKSPTQEKAPAETEDLAGDQLEQKPSLLHCDALNTFYPRRRKTWGRRDKRRSLCTLDDCNLDDSIMAKARCGDLWLSERIS